MSDPNEEEDLTSRPSYTPSQLSTYLSLLSLPPSTLSNPSLPHLSHLLTSHLCTFPFENLSLHYSPTHTISLSPSSLWTNFIEQRRGRGGYCMENNTFFSAVLRGMGYTVTSVGGRVSESVNGGDGRRYGGWSHMVNIVTLQDGKRYMVDVGFGGNGATTPLLLKENVVTERIAPSQSRLIKSALPQHTDQENQRMWIYQVRPSPGEEWVPQYCFSETEFLPADYEVMNFWASQNPQSVFRRGILMAKMVMDGNGKIVGQMTMRDGEARYRRGNEVVQTVVCRSEEERVRLLKDWFGITLTEEERRGIGGLVTELKG
ncbi:MAG: hypothetical protein Q9220_004784 [cf. Caloplaca sp. 1 TL-2023]